MSDFLALDALVLDPRFNGPPGTANGGYACGAMGELVDGPAEVTLLSSPWWRSAGTSPPRAASTTRRRRC